MNVGVIEHGEDEVMAYLGARRALLDDIIITQMATLDTDTANDPRELEKLKLDIKREVNSVFSNDFLKHYSGKGNPVKRVLITEYVIA